jgi:L-lactate dehydrogenase (cytochrome)
MKNITCIEDLRALHRRKVPRAFFDYADSGSYSEETLRANRADLEHIKLRQRVLVDVSDRSLATTILGRRRRDSRCAGCTGRRHPIHAFDDVDLFD